MEKSWSDLPSDLLQMICRKLDEVNDYVRFGAVCTTWLSVAHQASSGIPPQLPFIMLPSQSISEEETRDIYSLSDQQAICKSKVRMPADVDCWSSSQGWVLATNTNNLYLLNPFVSKGNLVILPPLDNSFISKVVLSGNPTLTSEYFVVVIYSFHRKLAFIRHGDISWSCVDSMLNDFEDVIYHKDEVVAVNSDGDVLSFHVNSPVDVKELAPEENMFTSINEDNESSVFMYLVESGGELLLIKRFIDKKSLIESGVKKSTKVEVLQYTKSKWIELNTLNGHIVFIGENSSFSLVASRHWRCKPNHVLFIDDMLASFNVRGFDVEASIFDEIFTGSLVGYEEHPILWIQPTLNYNDTTDQPSSQQGNSVERRIWESLEWNVV